jgi:hypothetical protein
MVEQGQVWLAVGRIDLNSLRFAWAHTSELERSQPS